MRIVCAVILLKSDKRLGSQPRLGSGVYTVDDIFSPTAYNSRVVPTGHMFEKFIIGGTKVFLAAR